MTDQNWTAKRQWKIMWSGVSSASPQIEHAGESTIFLRYNKFERHWGQKNSWTLGGAAFFQMKDLLGSRVAAILQLPVLVLAIVLLSQNSSPGWNSLCLSVDPCQSRSGCNSEAPFSEIHRTHRRRQDIPDYRRRCEEIGSKLRQRIVPEEMQRVMRIWNWKHIQASTPISQASV
jgi:hypothetical protein